MKDGMDVGAADCRWGGVVLLGRRLPQICADAFAGGVEMECTVHIIAG